MHAELEDLGTPGPTRAAKTRAAEPRSSTDDHHPHPAPPTWTGSDSHIISTKMGMYKTDEMETNDDEQGLSALARKAFEKIGPPPFHHPHLAPTTRVCSKSHDHGSISLTEDTNKTGVFGDSEGPGHHVPPRMMAEFGFPRFTSHTPRSSYTAGLLRFLNQREHPCHGQQNRSHGNNRWRTRTPWNNA
jgi:hypothetical protein